MLITWHKKSFVKFIANLPLLYEQSLATKLVVALLNIFLFEVNFDKSTIGLHIFLISFILAKFLKK